jgi:subtilisin family serine protease
MTVTTVDRIRMTEHASVHTAELQPQRKLDTIIVKLRSSPAAVRRFSMAARDPASLLARGASVASTPQPFLAQLVERGFAKHVTSVFPATQPPTPTLAIGGAVRALAAAVAPSSPVKKALGLVSITLDRATDPDQLVAHLNTLQSEIEYAYVPQIKYPFPARKKAKRKGADPLQSRQWGHTAVKIREARARAGFKDAEEVIVAVVDSGIDARHPDLKASIKSYVNFLSTEDDRDYKGHGTHVAGIIAAARNNRIGVAGLCNAKIMALKGLPRSGNEWDASAYYRALAHPITNGARVLNLSLGGGLDPGERDVIADLIGAGVVVVAAMGNEFEEGNPIEYPAAYPGVIAVGATDEVDRRASFSCTGTHIALVAPGERILSTTPRYASEFAKSTMYDSWPGTSMATPHVAAAAALLLAKSPTLTPGQVRDKLIAAADKVPSQTSRQDREYGAGRLNIAAALA